MSNASSYVNIAGIYAWGGIRVAGPRAAQTGAVLTDGTGYPGEVLHTAAT